MNNYHVQLTNQFSQEVTSAILASADKGKYLDVKVGTDGTRLFYVRDHSFWRHFDIGPVSRAAMSLMRELNIPKSLPPSTHSSLIDSPFTSTRSSLIDSPVLPADRLNKIGKILNKLKSPKNGALYEVKLFDNDMHQATVKAGGVGKETGLILKSAIDDKRLTIQDAIKQKLITAGNAIDQSYITLQEAINQKLITPKEAINQKLITVEEAINQKLITPKEAINQKLITVEDAINQKLITPKEAINQRCMSVQDSINQGFITVQQAIDQKLMTVQQANEHLDGWLGDQARGEKTLMTKESHSFEELKAQVFNKEHMRGFGDKDPFMGKNSSQTKRDVLRTHVNVAGKKIENPAASETVSQDPKEISDREDKKLEELKGALKSAANEKGITLSDIQLGILSELLAQTVDKDAVLESAELIPSLNKGVTALGPNYLSSFSEGRTVNYSFEGSEAKIEIKKLFKIKTPEERDFQRIITQKGMTLQEAEALLTITLDLRVDPHSATPFITVEAVRGPYRTLKE